MKRLLKVFLLFSIITMIFWGEVIVSQAVDTVKPDDYVVVLDVSGSMNKTDKERLSFEAIKMLSDICDKEDRIAVITFNEGIVYESLLVPVKDTESVKSVIHNLDNISFHGDTDNGLAMRKGVDLLQNNSTKEERNRNIIFISDGQTDLSGTNSERTVQQSVDDMEYCRETAKEESIAIYTIGFSTSGSSIIDEMTAISTATKAQNYVCAGPLQMLNTITNIVKTSKSRYENMQQTVKTSDKLATMDITISQTDMPGFIIFASSSPIEDFEIIAKKNQGEVSKTTHCLVVKFEQMQEETMSLCYRTKEQGNAILNIMTMPKQEEITTEEETKVAVIEKEPVAKKAEISLDGDETEHKTLGAASISRKDIIFYVALAVIIFATLLVSILIIVAFFHKKEKTVKPLAILQGYLHATFIDLKSKNERPDAIWNLREYPEEGVTLQELFHSIDMKEDLPNLDKICLYPNEKQEGLLLVHCSEGGVFINDNTVSANVPSVVHYGDTIYIAFSENASEFSLRYTQQREG